MRWVTSAAPVGRSCSRRSEHRMGGAIRMVGMTGMGGTTELGYGWLTPVLSYAMAVLGSALGLRCMVRALAADGRSRRNWLLTGATAIGIGIWTMHFIAMLGFTVTGTEIRYDVPLTLLSLLVAILFVGVGAFAVAYGRHRGRS